MTTYPDGRERVPAAGRKPALAGWRKPTPGLCRANALAKDGEGQSVSKNRAMLALRRVAPAIGLKPGDVLMLDTLAVFTRPCDWEEGARPIVWPSNDYLIDATGLSLSAVKRHLRKLVERGLIACKDSSNGKRWGHRDEEGRIREAYGFDLSPLAARAGEFEVLHAQIQAERDLRKALRRQITILRRTVRALLDSAPVPVPVPVPMATPMTATAADGLWRDVSDIYEALVARLSRGLKAVAALYDLHDAFFDLKERAEEAMREAAPCEESKDCYSNGKYQDMDPSGAEFEPHIPITTYPQSVKGKGHEKTCTRQARVPEPHAAEWGQEPHAGPDAEAGAKNGALSLRTVLYACPAFAEIAHGLGSYIHDWREFVVAAERIRPMVGISEDAWASARDVLGAPQAAAALALIADKVSQGTVSSPGGYLRGLTAKARKGDLHLARSVHGRLSERRRRGEGA